MSKGLNIGHYKSGQLAIERWKKVENKYNEKPKLCKECNIALPWKKKRNTYCSHSCSAKHNNLGVQRHGKVPGNCKNCQQKLKTSIAKYCNSKCFSLFKHKKYNNNIEQKGDFGNITSYTRAKIYIIEKRGHKCEICKNETWLNNPIPLVFDHIDGRSKNNKLSNIRLVCGNCDMQLPTYKRKNKNSDRTKRYLKQRK